MLFVICIVVRCVCWLFNLSCLLLFGCCFYALFVVRNVVFRCALLVVCCVLIVERCALLVVCLLFVVCNACVC